MKEHVRKEDRVAGCVNISTWCNKYLSQQLKVRIHKAIMRPILTYVVKTRSETKGTQKSLQALGMQVLCKTVNKSLRERERNADIR